MVELSATLLDLTATSTGQPFGNDKRRGTIMWICSKLGFFSIVKKGEPHTWQIRAHCKHDLEGLLAALSLDKEVLSTPQADYAFRILVNHQELERAFAALGDSIDYPNFKGCIGALSDQRDKLPAYHAFWRGMAEVQDMPKSPGTKNGAAESRTREQVIRRTRGGIGSMARMLKTIRGFRDKHGHWPTKLRLSTEALTAWREETLTPLGFQLLESKLRILPEAKWKLVAEDDAGLTLDFDSQEASSAPWEGADEWLWNVKV
ncbi:MAG: hypothetical protein LV481_03140 [Methylacidiphilales bacterium]|nr:hypothetical protein [Candidatus Methylacidiphilales bacterium]